MTSALENDLLDFLAHVMARPCKSQELITELIKMATHNRAWSSASCEQWQEVLEVAVARGKIVRIGQTLWLPKAVEKLKPKQRELF